jgi:class 3 adenylate cyclase
VARLDSAQRDRLPDRAFAYIDSNGQRRLPIHDESHVRSAFARFGQVAFESDGARERARTRLLNAAKKHGIVPVGFITAQLQTARDVGLDVSPLALPSGFVTLLMTDVEGSTALVRRLGERYRELIREVRAILRDAAAGVDGVVVETRADELFAAFEQPGAAIDMAVAIQRPLKAEPWTEGLDVRVRVGIHSGYPTLADENYMGLAVHATARICDAAHGGQILVSGDTRDAMRAGRPVGVRFRSVGEHRLRGLPDVFPLYQVMAKGLGTRFPPLRSKQ